MDYISVKEAAQRWGVSQRRVHQYCLERRIAGVKKFGRSWAIPEVAEKPTDPRRKKSTGSKEKPDAIQEVSKSDDKLSVGAVIVAAGNYKSVTGISPFIEIGGMTLIRRIIITFQQAGITDIVVVTGYRSWEIEHHLMNYGVVFLQNGDYEEGDKLTSAKIGLEFLSKKCDKVFFASLRIPMFMPETLRKMVLEERPIVIPQYQGISGHPILLDAKIIPEILMYGGPEGMRGALRPHFRKKAYLQVEDKGVLLSAANISRLEETAEEYKDYLMRPFVRINIERNRSFFDGRGKLLLFLINEFHSVQRACNQMAISKGKAWEIIDTMEAELGMKIVKRRQGGKSEGRTALTEEGLQFLKFFQNYEREVKEYATVRFEEAYEGFLKKIKKG